MWNPDVSAAGKNEGWNIVLKCQPPNSPDLNVLDLGYFASIQSIQYQCSPANIDELIQCVEEAYWSQPTVTTEKIFLSYQMAMESIMEVNGSNNYKLQHMSKDKLLRSDGGLPQVLPCSEEAVNAALEMLSWRFMFMFTLWVNLNFISENVFYFSNIKSCEV